MLRLVLAAGFALLATACASEPAPNDRECFSTSLIRGYDVIDEHHVRVTVRSDRAYILSTDWNVRDLDWSRGIAIRSTSHRLCTGNGIGVEVMGGRPPRSYPITSIEREAAPAASRN